MKTALLLLLLPLVLISCKWTNKNIEGNGNIVTQKREVKKAERLVFKGDFDVLVQSGPVTSVSVEADENLQNFVIMTESDRSLVFKTKSKFNLKSDHGVLIRITTPKLESVEITGTGTVKGEGKFSGGEELVIDISGSGKADFMVNTPKVEVKIAGVGNLKLSGETKKASFNIAGSGECDALELKSETANVKVAGVGTVKIFAAVLLDVNVAGSGTVFYKGAATIKQKIAGVGSIKKID